MAETNEDAAAALSSNSRMASAPTAVFAKYIVIMIAVSAIVVFFGVKPALEGFFSNNTKTTQQVEANKANDDKFKELMGKQANLSKTESQVNAFLRSFPSNSNQKTMIDDLNAIATKNGVSIQSISPSVGGKSGSGSTAGSGSAPSASGAAAGAKQASGSSLVAPLNLDISLSGGNTNGFLADLEKADRVFVINSLSYTAADGKGGETMSLKATTFMVQPLADPRASGTTTGTQTGAQPQGTTPSAAPSQAQKS